MNNEYAILSYLDKNQDTSQRKIAQGTDLSPATVNLVLKKMVRKGLVKLERVNGRTLRYILTPQGMAEKVRLAYHFMVNSYRQIIKVKNTLEEIIREHQDHRGVPDKLIFYGPKDEILETLKIAAGNLNLKYEIVFTQMDLKKLNGENILIITWVPSIKSKLGDRFRTINILEVL